MLHELAEVSKEVIRPERTTVPPPRSAYGLNYLERVHKEKMEKSGTKSCNIRSQPGFELECLTGESDK
jgi:hypothetical protein